MHQCNYCVSKTIYKVPAVVLFEMSCLTATREADQAFYWSRVNGPKSCLSIKC